MKKLLLVISALLTIGAVLAVASTYHYSYSGDVKATWLDDGTRYNTAGTVTSSWTNDPSGDIMFKTFFFSDGSGTFTRQVGSPYNYPLADLKCSSLTIGTNGKWTNKCTYTSPVSGLLITDVLKGTWVFTPKGWDGILDVGVAGNYRQDSYVSGNIPKATVEGHYPAPICRNSVDMTSLGVVGANGKCNFGLGMWFIGATTYVSHQ